MSTIFEQQVIETPPKLVSVSAQIRQALLDNRQMSNRELTKYLNIDKKQCMQHLVRLRRQKFVEHVGYDRYTLTDKGREAIAFDMQGKQPRFYNKPSQPVETDEATDKPKAQPKAIAPKLMTSEIDWAREYIALVNKMVESFAKQNQKE